MNQYLEHGYVSVISSVRVRKDALIPSWMFYYLTGIVPLELDTSEINLKMFIQYRDSNYSNYSKDLCVELLTVLSCIYLKVVKRKEGLRLSSLLLNVLNTISASLF